MGSRFFTFTWKLLYSLPLKKFKELFLRIPFTWRNGDSQLHESRNFRFRMPLEIRTLALGRHLKVPGSPPPASASPPYCVELGPELRVPFFSPALLSRGARIEKPNGAP